MITLNSLINRISTLEDKQENGTITMTEITMLLIFIEKAEEMIYSKSNKLSIVK